VVLPGACAKRRTPEVAAAWREFFFPQSLPPAIGRAGVKNSRPKAFLSGGGLRMSKAVTGLSSLGGHAPGSRTSSEEKKSGPERPARGLRVGAWAGLQGP